MPNLTQAKKSDVTYDIKDSTAREEITNVKSAIGFVSPIDLIRNRVYNPSTTGISVTWDSVKGKYHITGTPTSDVNFWLSDNKFAVDASHDYFLILDAESENNIWVQAYKYSQTSGPVNFGEMQGNGNKIITTGADTVAMRVRLKCLENTTYDTYINAYVSEIIPNELLENKSLTVGGALPSCSLNDVVGVNKVYILLSSNSYTDLPGDAETRTFFLFSYQVSDRYGIHLLYSFSGGTVWKRRFDKTNSTFEEWQKIESGTEVINYITNEYDVTATPTITTDTNQFLASTGDDTDVTLSIQTLLATYGICRLGPGDFYVSGVDMPSGTAIIGSGFKTRVRLIGTQSTEGYAIKVNDNCIVSNLQIAGTDASGITLSSTIGNRHGILFEGHASDDTSQWDYTYHKININNCWIHNFHGSGIKCNNTGYNSNACLMVSDVWIYYCNCGLYIPFFSEFNRFTGLHCNTCYYGCINNGGNNVFVNCNFSSNKLGFLMDNSDGNARNNSHGSVVGCIFDHSDGNYGVGIKIIGNTNGEIFSNCQVFYSDIVVENSAGIVFNSFNIGGGNVDISVIDGDDGGLVLFDGCVLKSGTYTIDISRANNKAKFVNCWLRDGTALSVT